jgi:DNA-binding beta-propeller fold protein YncE
MPFQTEQQKATFSAGGRSPWASANTLPVLAILALALLPLLTLIAVGHRGLAGPVETVWGSRGVAPGQLQKPRAMAIDQQDRLYIVDMTARIQVFDRDGNYLSGWRTPASQDGKPTGLSFDRDGNLLVADTHYHRVLFYRPDGTLLEERTLGGVPGTAPGQFGLVTDAVQDSQRNYYVAEYGENDRIQKFSPTGQFILQWGGHGSGPGQFLRPQSLAIDQQDHLWVADACNHRIQVFETSPGGARLVRCWGEEGSLPGQLRYPYKLVLDDKGQVYVCEFGNHRVQKFSRDGRFLASWGTSGREPGEVFNPWAIVQDSLGRIHVLDTYNHRVQRIRL